MVLLDQKTYPDYFAKFVITIDMPSFELKYCSKWHKTQWSRLIRHCDEKRYETWFTFFFTSLFTPQPTSLTAAEARAALERVDVACKVWFVQVITSSAHELINLLQDDYDNCINTGFCKVSMITCQVGIVNTGLSTSVYLFIINILSQLYEVFLIKCLWIWSIMQALSYG